MTKEIPLVEALKLVKFVKSTSGGWQIKNIYGDVHGDLYGNVHSDVWGKVYGDVWGNVYEENS